jgi:hypothetical protein
MGKTTREEGHGKSKRRRRGKKRGRNELLAKKGQDAKTGEERREEQKRAGTPRQNVEMIKEQKKGPITKKQHETADANAQTLFFDENKK